jgi:hypothetical protein
MATAGAEMLFISAWLRRSMHYVAPLHGDFTAALQLLGLELPRNK